MQKKFKINDPIKYERLMKNHVCRVNHNGSAPAMEISGAKRTLQRSIEMNKNEIY